MVSSIESPGNDVETSVDQAQGESPRSLSRFCSSLRTHGSYYLFILPSLVLLMVFFFHPALMAILYAFYEWDGSSKVFIGLDNFRDMARDPILRESFGNLAILTSLGMLIGLLVPVIVAELIFNLGSTRWQKFFQISFLVTCLVPGVVIMLIWQFIYNPYFGPLNAFLELLGFDKMDFLWLAGPKSALYSLLGIGFPWVSGTSVLIILAGLNTIPTSLLDYCRLEGVGAWRRFFSMDLFFIVSQVRLLSVTGFIGAMQAFGLQLILTSGGPGTATMVPGYHMYLNAFSYDRLGYASAIGLLLAIVILVFTILNMRFIKAGTVS